MKCRVLILLDLDIPTDGGFAAAAEAEAGLKKLIAEYVRDNQPMVIHNQMEIKERRGSGAPDLSRMKFRTN